MPINSWSWFTTTYGDWPVLRCRPRLLDLKETDIDHVWVVVEIVLAVKP
jgi:hypothetical protein